MQLHGLHHVTLTVTDLDRTAAWYRTVLGFQDVVRYRNDAIAAECQVLTHPSASPPNLGLRQYDGAGTDRFDEHRTGLDHLAFDVGAAESLTSWQEHLHSRGVEFHVTALPELTILVMRDPDNIQVELCTTTTGAPSSIDADGRIILPGD